MQRVHFETNPLDGVVDDDGMVLFTSWPARQSRQAVVAGNAVKVVHKVHIYLNERTH